MFYNTFSFNFGPVNAAGVRPNGETAGPSSRYAMTCAGWGGLAGSGGRAGSGTGGPGRVGRCGPVLRCYAALLIWQSYINTIRALCVRSDGECDLMLAEILI
jgi:hypothetical protein